MSAGLRAANARLRELLAERDTRIGQMEAQIADLQEQVADLAARGEAELGELLEAAIIGRAGQARPKVAAEEDGT